MARSLREAPTLLIVVFLVLCLAMGAFFMTWGVRTVIRQHASTDWPSTEGTVTDREWDSDTNGSSGYEHTYEYRVDGRVYQGTFGEDIYHDRHPVGASVEVWYDPENPEDETTVQGLGIGHFAPILIGFVAAGLSIPLARRLWLRFGAG